MTLHIEQTNMIKQQLRTGDVLNQNILDLYDTLPRHEFVPSIFRDFAYSDLQLELPHGQRMMAPLEEAKLLQALNLSGTETVLEIGTGTGYFTALLSRLCKKVISVDFFPEFTTHAKTRLSAFKCDNVELFTGDASRGWLNQAPYDAVIFTGAVEALVDTHKLQVMPGGQCFALIGKEPVIQGQLHRLSHDNIWSMELIFETSLPPLIDPLKTEVFKF